MSVCRARGGSGPIVGSVKPSNLMQPAATTRYSICSVATYVSLVYSNQLPGRIFLSPSQKDSLVDIAGSTDVTRDPRDMKPNLVGGFSFLRCGTQVINCMYTKYLAYVCTYIKVAPVAIRRIGPRKVYRSACVCVCVSVCQPVHQCCK